MREITVVIGLTILGAVIRFWALDRLGLVHFDEGIYAFAGTWAVTGQGLRGLDPALIAYAPPGFPIMVGLAYVCFGVGDVAAILVSIMSGTLTIPLVGWLAHRTFGRGAGAAAAAFAAFSPPHIAFSRMALTDATSLLFWALALGQGQRFLERPNPLRAIALGLAVGIAQLFKYNGWISGVIVAASAALWQAFHRDRAVHGKTIATWGWGLSAAVLSGLIYWPWYQFVEAHGGYSALLAHQRGYLSGLSHWPGHWLLQLGQARALSFGHGWLACGGLAGAAGLLISTSDSGIERRIPARVLLEVLGLALLCVLPDLGWIVPLGGSVAMVTFARRGATSSIWLVGVGWVTFMLLTPLYHPYARLWLPLHGFGWLFLGGLLALVRSREIVTSESRLPWNRPALRLSVLAACCVCASVLLTMEGSYSSQGPSPGLLEPSDSLRLACRALSRDLPGDVRVLRFFGRPPAAFYLSLAGDRAVFREPSYDRFLGAARARSWAVLDTALLRQEGTLHTGQDALTSRWALVQSVATTLNLPTLLDIDPGAAFAGPIDRTASLLLLRAR